MACLCGSPSGKSTNCSLSFFLCKTTLTHRRQWQRSGTCLAWKWDCQLSLSPQSMGCWRLFEMWLFPLHMVLFSLHWSLCHAATKSMCSLASPLRTITSASVRPQTLSCIYRFISVFQFLYFFIYVVFFCVILLCCPSNNLGCSGVHAVHKHCLHTSHTWNRVYSHLLGCLWIHGSFHRLLSYTVFCKFWDHLFYLPYVSTKQPSTYCTVLNLLILRCRQDGHLTDKKIAKYNSNPMDHWHCC